MGNWAERKIYGGRIVIVRFRFSSILPLFVVLFLCCRVFWGSPEKMIFERATSSVQWSSGQSGYQV